MEFFKEIYLYRDMLYNMIKRELRGRYKGSALGFLWTFLNPLFQLVVYTLVFSVIMRAGIEDYYLFLFVGLIPWIFFSTSMVGGANCIRSQKDMVNKIYFPREILPITHVTSQLINMLLSFVIVFGALFISGKGVDLKALSILPLIILAEYFFVLGLVLIISAVTVYLRDIEHVITIVVMAWQFLSPVMYDYSMVPAKYRMIFQFNPMAPIITAYRDVLYYQEIPELNTLLAVLALGLCLLFFGIMIFRNLQKRFAEEL